MKIRVPGLRSGKAGKLIYPMSAAVLLLFFVSSCGEDKKDGSPFVPGSNTINNELTFEYPDGTGISMGTDYSICCGIWEPGFVDEWTLKVFFYNPSFDKSFWKLFVITDEITAGSTYSLPTPGSPLRMFLVDINNSNELSSDDMDSSGTITINSLDCGPPVIISLTIDATIGSEYGDMPPVNVRGSFSCVLYLNPAPFGCEFSL